jgi:hypothetical protein
VLLPSSGFEPYCSLLLSDLLLVLLFDLEDRGCMLLRNVKRFPKYTAVQPEGGRPTVLNRYIDFRSCIESKKHAHSIL